VVLDVSGVGYRVHVPDGTAGHVAAGGRVELHVHTHVREDQIALFGFEDGDQLATFEVLLKVSGIGPRVALAILGDIRPSELTLAVERGDTARLKKLSGVGKKLAERLVVELRGKLVEAGVVPELAPVATRERAGDVLGDVASALANLDFRRAEIDHAIATIQAEMPDAKDFDTLFRAAMAAIRR
jgi:Holliday junction DNA helicase RuvA